MAPSRSKAIARELVVPWSSANMYCDMTDPLFFFVFLWYTTVEMDYTTKGAELP